MHITINPDGHIRINIVSLGFELEVWCNIVATKDLCDAIDNISVEYLGGFAVNGDFFPMELGTKCW